MTNRTRLSPAIEARGLSKRFGSVVAVDDLSFDIPVGKVTGFLGPNGAGKSTAMRMVLGLVAADAGHARVLGEPFAQINDPLRRVGALLDLNQFHPLRSGRDHLMWLAYTAGITSEQVDEVLGMVQLADAADRKVKGYSLGMKQRLGLAAALMGDPHLLVLDEPANGLDPAGIRWLRDLLRDFASRDRAVFVSSHLLAQMADMASEVVVIDQGRLVTHSSVAELLDRSSSGVRVVTPEPERMAEALSSRSIQHERVATDVLKVGAAPSLVGQIAAAAGIPIYGLEEQERSLEDVFFELTAREGSPR